MIIWEYISPYWRQGALNLNLVYRAYRAPYEWVPQISRPRERAIKRLDVKTFRVPGATELGRDRTVVVRGTDERAADGALCVTAENVTPPLSLGG